MARVFVFSEWGSTTTPSIEQVAAMLPDDARIIAYNIHPDMSKYFMVAFDILNPTYHLWCHYKESDIPIYLEDIGHWRLRS